ncbi:MAG TPA: RtcB family protein [Vicinamibacteria bacterium]|nr:RtcB family protein [Vicinamibacteria bacterium]
MDLGKLRKKSENEWWIAPTGKMRVPAVIYGTKSLVADMDEKVYEQVTNVAKLPGIVKAAYAMPDAHWGYGFPIGGVAAFDPDEGGVVSAGGVGFDISCGVRLLHTGLGVDEIERVKSELAEALFRAIPAGVGSRGKIRLNSDEMDAMLAGGARWAVRHGFGREEDLERIEERGTAPGGRPDYVSDRAKARQREQMGTLGSGNHYLEVQEVKEIYREDVARGMGLAPGDAVISIHCGSRGLGHQIGTDYLRSMVLAAPKHGIDLPDRELACVPLRSDIGKRYLGAMRAGINCALANREIITHLVRQAVEGVLGEADLTLLYDVSHNTCKEEEHEIDGKRKRLFVHRKGATRAFGPGHPDLPPVFRDIGQPVLIGGTMGTASYVLVGTTESKERSFASACHGAGRAMSRHQALKRWRGREVIESLGRRGILVRGHSYRDVAEEAPEAYKDVDQVVKAADRADLAHMVAKLVPLICIKG